MDYIYIGKIVNTHGIKGEMRLISDFDFKNQIFKRNQEIYIGKNKSLEVINSYRKHKQYDMITIVGVNNINDILKYKSDNVYINKEDLELDENEYVKNDLISCEVFNESGVLIGLITDIRSNTAQDLIEIDNKKLIPLVDEFIVSVDINKKKVIIREIDGLL